MIAEDLPIFIGDFGEAVTFGTGGAAFTRNAIFDEAHFLEADPMADVSSRKPMLTLLTSDAATVTRGLQVTIRGVNYRVSDIQPNGTGITELVLYKL